MWPLRRFVALAMAGAVLGGVGIGTSVASAQVDPRQGPPEAERTTTTTATTAPPRDTTTTAAPPPGERCFGPVTAEAFLDGNADGEPTGDAPADGVKVELAGGPFSSTAPAVANQLTVGGRAQWEVVCTTSDAATVGFRFTHPDGFVQGADGQPWPDATADSDVDPQGLTTLVPWPTGPILVSAGVAATGETIEQASPCPGATPADVEVDPGGDWDGDGIPNADELAERSDPCAAPPQECNFSISGTIWDDGPTPDGVRSSTEPGVADVEVQFFTTGTAPFETVVTGPDGRYSWVVPCEGGVALGDALATPISVRVVLPAGASTTVADVGDDATDSDLDAAGAATQTVASYGAWVVDGGLEFAAAPPAPTGTSGGGTGDDDGLPAPVPVIIVVAIIGVLGLLALIGLLKIRAVRADFLGKVQDAEDQDEDDDDRDGEWCPAGCAKSLPTDKRKAPKYTGPRTETFILDVKKTDCVHTTYEHANDGLKSCLWHLGAAHPGVKHKSFGIPWTCTWVVPGHIAFVHGANCPSRPIKCTHVTTEHCHDIAERTLFEKLASGAGGLVATAGNVVLAVVSLVASAVSFVVPPAKPLTQISLDKWDHRRLRDMDVTSYCPELAKAMVPDTHLPDPGRENVFFVNGMNTNWAKAMGTRQQLVDYFGTEVRLIHNRTESALLDPKEVVDDYAWPLKRATKRFGNTTTITVIGLLEHGYQRDARVSLIGSSQGTLITANAVLAFAEISPSHHSYLASKVRLLHSATVVHQSLWPELRARLQQYECHVDPRDPIATFLTGWPAAHNFGLTTPDYTSYQQAKNDFNAQTNYLGLGHMTMIGRYHSIDGNYAWQERHIKKSFFAAASKPPSATKTISVTFTPGASTKAPTSVKVEYRSPKLLVGGGSHQVVSVMPGVPATVDLPLTGVAAMVPGAPHGTISISTAGAFPFAFTGAHVTHEGAQLPLTPSSGSVGFMSGAWTGSF